MVGRWTSSDPGGFVDGLNMYVYVWNNPVKLVDEEEPPEKGDPIKKHKIIEGDNLSTIAKKYNTTIEQLVEWNNLDGASMSGSGYYPGSELIVGNSHKVVISSPWSSPWKNLDSWALLDNPKLNVLHADNVINMYDATSIQSWNSLGAPRSSSYFWNEFKDTPLGKRALSKDNLTRIANGNVARVDDQWNKIMGDFGLDGINKEQIQHHHMNKQAGSIPVPQSKHSGFNKYFHKMHERTGPVNQTKNNVKNRTNRYDPSTGSAVKKFQQRTTKAMGLLDLIPIVLDSPNSPIYLFHRPGSGSENRAYPTNLWGENDPAFYEMKMDKSGVRTIIYYNSYEKRDGAWRGANPTGRIDYFDKNGSKLMDMI